MEEGGFRGGMSEDPFARAWIRHVPTFHNGLLCCGRDSMPARYLPEIVLMGHSQTSSSPLKEQD